MTAGGEVLQAFLHAAQDVQEMKTIIIMGSYGSQLASQNIGSDIDLYIVSTATTAGNLILSIVQRVWPMRILYHFMVEEHKLVVFLKDPIIKLDLAFGRTMEEYSRYLRGSEMCRIGADKTGTGEKQLSDIMATRACDCLPEYKANYHIIRFLEMYELLCKNIVRKDAYRVKFYGFLLLHALVDLELIMCHSETTHLYLPKAAFSKGLQCENLTAITLPKQDDHLGALWNALRSYTNLFLNLASKDAAFKETELQNFFEAITAHYEKPV